MTTETVEVDLFGVKVAVPKADADKLIAGRTALKAESRDAHEQLGRIKAEKDAAEAARVKAENEAKAAEAMKKGELDKATELLTKQHREREAKIAAQLRDKALKAAIAAAPKIVPAAVDDIVDQLRARSRYDFDSDTVVVTDSAGAPVLDTSGKPVAVDAYIGEWLGKRPHYLLSDVKPGSGAAGAAAGAAGAKTMPIDALAKLAPVEQAKFYAEGGKPAG